MSPRLGWLALLLLAFPWTASVPAPPEPIRIVGRVMAPGGTPVVGGGSVACRLTPEPATAPDGSMVATVQTGTIAATGDLSLSLIPNDALVPAGTVYVCTFQVGGAASRKQPWTVTWQLASVPAELHVGAVPRLNVAPGAVVPGVTYAADADLSAKPCRQGVAVAADTGGVYTCDAGTGLMTRRDLYVGRSGSESVSGVKTLADGAVFGSRSIVSTEYGYPAPVEATFANAAGSPGYSGARIIAKHAPDATFDPWESTEALSATATARFTGNHPNLLVRGAFLQGSLNYGDADAVSGSMAGLHGASVAAVTYKAGSDALALPDLTGLHASVNNNGPGVNVTTMRAVMAKISGGSGKTTPNADAIQVAPPGLSGHTVTNYAGIRVKDQYGASATLTNADALVVDAQGFNNAARGNLRLAGGRWNSGHLQIADQHLWYDGTGLRFKSGLPASATDGTAFSSLALDSAVAHIAGAETIAGEKTFDRDADGTGDDAEPWELPTLLFEDYAGQGLGKTGSFSSGTSAVAGSYLTAVPPAIPEQDSSVVGGVYIRPGTAAGNDAGMVVAGTASTTTNTFRFEGVQSFAARVRPGATGATATNKRLLVGGVRTVGSQDLATKTNAIAFWCSPTADNDGDGVAGDSNGDGDCADAGEDPDECAWYTLTMAGATDGAFLVGRANTTATNTAIDCTGTDGRYLRFQISPVAGTSARFQIVSSQSRVLYDGTQLTNVPSGALGAGGWYVWREATNAGQGDTYVDWVYYRGKHR